MKAPRACLVALALQLFVSRAVAACPLLFFDPKTPQTVFVTYSDVGIFKSTDNGNSWKPLNLFAPGISDVIVDPQTPQVMYAASYTGVMKSTDNGVTWTSAGLSDQHIEAVSVNAPVLVALARGDTSRGRPDIVFRSVDAGKTWERASDGLPEHGIRFLAHSPQDPMTIFAGTDAGIFKTTSAGKSWSRSGAGLPRGAVGRLVVDAGNPAVLYASTSATSGTRVFKTTDAGRSWKAVGKGLPSSTITLAQDPTRPQLVYAGTAGKGLYKSTDGGATWISAGIRGAYVCRIAVAPQNSQSIFLATSGDPYQGYATRLFKTLDGGSRWTEVVDEDLPSVFSYPQLKVEPTARR